MKRVFDVCVSAAALVVAAPLVAVAALAVWANDRHTPFHVSRRLRDRVRTFPMYKLRSMVPEAARVGGVSTALDDRRITPVGRVLRRFKLDELPQLWNVLVGHMSLVGPRPQVPEGVGRYTDEEMRLLDVRPGVTDYASIVFADEADILAGQADPEAAYDTLIRPLKSRLGLFYVEHRSFMQDLSLIGLTLVSAIWRGLALQGVQRLLARSGAPAEIVELAGRRQKLQPTLPPGESGRDHVSHPSFLA